jgi:hypothetical protein
MGTKRHIPADVKARFFTLLHAGVSIKDASSQVGIHVNTGSRWAKKARAVKLELDQTEMGVRKARSGEGGAQRQAFNAFMDAIEMPGAMPYEALSENARKGLDDFGFFREYYLGRVPSPWQVEAGVRIVEYLQSEEKEYIVMNMPPGAGKSTLIHDVAVWAICRNREIRVMIGSVSAAMAKLYSRRIRETLERPFPIEPDPVLVKKGLAQNAQGCLAVDYGRFKPADKGSIWRAEEFTVEQIGGSFTDNKEPTVRAYGIEAEFIGHRADLCLFDDVASPDNARESVARDKLLERWDNVAEARVDLGGALIVVGQRLGSGDLYAHCLSKITYDEDLDDLYDGSDITSPEHQESLEPLKKQKYRHIIYQAYYPELDVGTPEEKKKLKRFDAPPYPDGPLLEPKRLPWKDLSFIRHNKPDTFSVVYQQEDLDIDGYLINKSWIFGGVGDDGVLYPGCIDEHRNHGQIPPHLAPPVCSFVSIDPSPTKFWALTWFLYQPELGIFHVVDIERTKLTAEDLLGYNTTTREYSGLMDEWQDRSFRLGYPISHWVVEINAAQRFLLAHDFVRKWASLNMVNIIPHTTSRNKLDENLGVEALLPPLIRSGNLRFPNNKVTWKTMAATQELTSWKPDKKNGTDIVMSLWMGVLNAPNISGFRLPPLEWRPTWMLR